MPSRRLAAGLAALCLLPGLAEAADSLPDSAAVCAHPPYEAHVVSSSPLVVYLAGFVTPAERAHLRAVSRDTFAHSAVAERGAADGRALHHVRTSQSASVPRDAVVRCLEERALRFQGLLGGAGAAARARVEPLQLVQYAAGEHYHYHTDWFTDPVHAAAALGGNRVSSFFAYVHVSGTPATGEAGDGAGDGSGNATDGQRLRGGGTNFPLLPPLGATDDDDDGDNSRWCAFVDCDEPWDRGVTFRPVEGNAVYWDNLLPDGDGDPRTLHAGLPVVRGAKTGLNIWTRQAPLPAAVRGE